MGCANQAGEDNRNVARMATLIAVLPTEVPGATIDRLCGSGMDAIGAAARAGNDNDVASPVGLAAFRSDQQARELLGKWH